MNSKTALTVIILGTLLLSTIPFNTIEEAEAAESEWTSLYTENFDSYAADTSPVPGWQNITAPTTHKVDTTYARSGSNSLYLDKTSGTGSLYTNLSFSEGTIEFHIYFTDTTTQKSFSLYGENGSYGNRITRILFQADGEIDYLQPLGTVFSSGVSYSADTWMKITVEMNSTKQYYSVSLDDTSIIKQAQCPYTYHITNSVLFDVSSTDLWVDDIYVNGTATTPDIAEITDYELDFDSSSVGTSGEELGFYSVPETAAMTTNEVDDAQAQSGANSLHLVTSTTTGVCKDIENVGATLNYSTYATSTTGTRRFYFWSDYNGQGRNIFSFDLYSGGGIWYKNANGGTVVSGETWSANQWNDISVSPDVRNQTFDITFNDVLIIDDAKAQYEFFRIRSLEITLYSTHVWIDDFGLTNTQITPATEIPRTLSENTILEENFMNLDTWTSTGTASASGGVCTISKDSSITANTPFPQKDHILYFKIKNTNTAGYYSRVNVSAWNGEMLYTLYLDYNTSTSSVQQGTVSIETGEGETVLAEGMDFTDWTEFALHHEIFNSVGTYRYVNIYTRNISTYTYLGNSSELEFAGGDNGVVNASYGSRAKNIEIWTHDVVGGETLLDYVYLCWPNFILIGDSLAAGEPGFQPNPTLGKQDYNSSLGAHMSWYTNNINTLLVNKGLNGQTSFGLSNLIEKDVSMNHPQVVIYWISHNDHGPSGERIEKQDNLDITNRILDFIKTTTENTATILLGPILPNSNRQIYPDTSTYYSEYNSNYLSNVENADMIISTMDSGIGNATGELDSAYESSGGIHINSDGYKKIGDYISLYTPKFDIFSYIISYENETNVSTTNQTTTFNFTTSPTIDYLNISWGDGNYTNITEDIDSIEYTWATVGNYTVNVTANKSSLGNEIISFVEEVFHYTLPDDTPGFSPVGWIFPFNEGTLGEPPVEEAIPDIPQSSSLSSIVIATLVTGTLVAAIGIGAWLLFFKP